MIHRCVVAILVASLVAWGLNQVAAAEVNSPIAAQRQPLPSAANFKPDPASVVRYGPAYRYPQAGWIVLHIEGAPYERGLQHGRLMAVEIVDFIKTLRHLPQPQSLERGLARRPHAGQRAVPAPLRRGVPGRDEGHRRRRGRGGRKYDDRPVDLIDIVSLNSDMEVHYLAPGVAATATGLEDDTYSHPLSTERPHGAEEHCSAFAATAPATANGEIVFGHITMCGLADAHHYNVWLDLRPTAGRRVVMQTYPGGIMSGLDYYLNDAGLLVLETTIRQTDFDITGLALASRIRRAVQYAETIDKGVEILAAANNGLYSNEWMFADTKTGEIAMFELGTHSSKLWRSSRREWPGGTEGFYWGCNNAKDLEVRKESLPSLGGKPGNLVLHPSDRDRTWLRLFARHRGKLTEDFGFEAFTTAPLAGFPSCDAKFTTTSLAKDLKSWALFGPPLGRAWTPSEEDSEHCPGLQPLVSNDWTLLAVDAIDKPQGEPPALADAALFPEQKEDRFDKPVSLAAAWRGTLLPKTDADTWLAAGQAGLERIVALEKALKEAAKGAALDRAAQDHLEIAVSAALAMAGGRRAAGARRAARGYAFRLGSERLVSHRRRQRRDAARGAARGVNSRDFRQADGPVRAGPCRPGSKHRGVPRRGRKGRRAITRRIFHSLAHGRRELSSDGRWILVDRFLRGGAGQGVDYLRHAGRSNGTA